MRILLGFCLLLELTSCAGLPAGDTNLLATGVEVSFPPHSFSDSFPGAASVLDGFDDSRSSDLAPWQVGESALYALELHSDGETKRKLALLSVASDRIFEDAPDGEGKRPKMRTIAINAHAKDVVWTSPVRRIEVQAFEAEGSKTSTSDSIAPERAFEEGLIQAARAAERLRRGASPEDHVQDLAAAGAALTNFTELVAGNQTLSPIFWSTVRRPSIWSIVTRRGVSISIKLDSKNVRRVWESQPGPDGGDPVYRIPVTIFGNEQPMLHAALWVTTPRPPLRIGGGILRIDGYRPGDQQTRFTIRLLAARGVDAEVGLGGEGPTQLR